MVWLTDVAQGSPEIYKSVDGGAHRSDVHDFPVFFIPGNGDSISGGAILVDPANSSRLYGCCAYTLGLPSQPCSAPTMAERPAQINLQAPFELPVGAASIVVKRGSQSSVERPIHVIPASPGYFHCGKRWLSLARHRAYLGL